MHHNVIKDCFGRHYRLHCSSDSSVQVAVKPKSFRDPVLTRQFVQGLRVNQGTWQHLLGRYNLLSPAHPLTDITIEQKISQLLIQGSVKLYPLSHLNGTKGATPASQTFPILPAEKGLSYQLVPASLLLVSTPPKIKEFNNTEEANHFITSLKIDDDQLAMLVHDLDLPVANGAQDHAKLLSELSLALAEKKAVVIVHQQSAAPPPKSGLDDSATQGPGNKSASLGPHEGGDTSEANTNTYKSQDEAAKAASKQILATSIAEDIEYGGMIYQHQDGTYGFSGPIKGEEGSVNPGGPDSVPEGTEAVAYWHTHGAYNPDYESENFSNYYDDEFQAWVGDIPYAKHYDVDAYVVTPEGKFKHYSVKNDKVTILGVID